MQLMQEGALEGHACTMQLDLNCLQADVLFFTAAPTPVWQTLLQSQYVTLHQAASCCKCVHAAGTAANAAAGSTATYTAAVAVVKKLGTSMFTGCAGRAEDLATGWPGVQVL